MSVIIVLVAGGDDLVVPGTFGGVTLPGILANAMQGHNAAALGQGVVVRTDHAAFARGEGLGGVEGEAGCKLQVASCRLQVLIF
jgi:hypothetical protein